NKKLYISGIHYGGVSLHYVDSNSDLRVFTLACQAYDYETQQSKNIRAFVERILDEFGLSLSDDVYIVTDNENKMTCAFKSNVQRIGCSAHYLNKILEHGFKKKDINCDELQSLFKSVHELVTHVRKCHKQSLLSVNVQSYCKTRFNGSYLMMNSVLNVFNELSNVISDDQKLNYLTISRDELQLVCLYLKHFDDVIERMGAEKKPTLHLVIPYKQLLINRSAINDDDTTHTTPLKKFIAKHVIDYWVLQDVHYLATMLHPNLVICRNTNVQDKTKTKDGNLVKPASSKTELDLYLCDETKIEKETNILNYWKLNETQYPILAQLAKQILCIPATSTAIERLFPYSGNTITNRRTRLETGRVNHLLFIQRNLSTLREISPPADEEFSKRKNSLQSTSSTPQSSPTKRQRTDFVGEKEENMDGNNDND
ncbi:unnamed protein product, partial [Didymodactylos carnosus]